MPRTFAEEKMPVLKLHSEQSVAAHVAKGWTLNRVFYDGGDKGDAYEYLLEPEDPSTPRATAEEVANVTRAFTVEDVFEVQQRGVVPTPGIPIESGIEVSDGDRAVVIGHQIAAMYPISPMVGLNVKSPFRPILLRGASKGEIEIGSSIWITHKTNSEQVVGGQPATTPRVGD